MVRTAWRVNTEQERFFGLVSRRLAAGTMHKLWLEVSADPLTGFGNAAFQRLDEELERATWEQGPLAVLFLGMDSVESVEHHRLGAAAHSLRGCDSLGYGGERLVHAQHRSGLLS